VTPAKAGGALRELGGPTGSIPLDALLLPALVVSPEGEPVEANGPARALLFANRELLVADLLRGLRTGAGPFALLPLCGARSSWFLAVRLGGPSERSQAAARRWRLTRRQSEVLALVARGCSNRAIAAELSCARSTVELHVSAILERTGCRARAEVVARVLAGD